MRHPASFQARDRSNPLREKSGSSLARDLYPATGMSGNLQGERYLGCQDASAVCRRAIAGWTTGRSCEAPSDGHWRSHPLNPGKHRRTDVTTTTSTNTPQRMQRMCIGITLAQSTSARCCENIAWLYTTFTTAEWSLTNVNLTRPFRLFDHFCFCSRLAPRERALAASQCRRAPQSRNPATSLLDQASGKRPK